MSEFITHSREETVALGAQVAQHLAPGALIAFTGGLGAGKTAFCEGIARGLGCTDPVSSPTFRRAADGSFFEMNRKGRSNR